MQVRDSAVFALPYDSKESLGFMEKYHYELGEDLEWAFYMALQSVYYHQMAAEEIDKAIYDYTNTEKAKLNASLYKRARILRDNEDNLSDTDLFTQKDRFTDICIEIFENFPLYQGEGYAFSYSYHPSYEAAYSMALIRHDRAVDYIKNTLPNINKLNAFDRQAVTQTAVESLE